MICGCPGGAAVFSRPDGVDEGSLMAEEQVKPLGEDGDGDQNGEGADGNGEEALAAAARGNGNGNGDGDGDAKNEQAQEEDDRTAMAVDREQPPRLPFVVVGMGGSAGGLEAFSAFLSAMPSDSGMAF